MGASVAYVAFIQASWTVLLGALVFLFLAVVILLGFAALVARVVRGWWA